MDDSSSNTSEECRLLYLRLLTPLGMFLHETEEEGGVAEAPPTPPTTTTGHSNPGDAPAGVAANLCFVVALAAAVAVVVVPGEPGVTGTLPAESGEGATIGPPGEPGVCASCSG